MKQHRILITGGAGFAGSHLVEALLAAGETDVHVTSYRESPGSFVSTLLPADHIHQLDLLNADQTKHVFATLQPTQVYHLAAHAVVGKSFEHSRLILEQTLQLQLNFLETMRTQCPESKILIVGSAMEYDVLHAQAVGPLNEDHPLGPSSPYAVAKVLQEMLAISYAHSQHLPIVRARSFNHIGERQTHDFAVPSFVEQIVKIERGQQSEILVGNLTSVRDFTDVKDVVKAYILLMERGQSGEVYNVGSGHGFTMEQILGMLCEMSTKKIEVRRDESKFRPSDASALIADVTKIKKLGWQPTIEISDTLSRIMNEWRNKE